jgi:predicted RNA methylase
MSVLEPSAGTGNLAVCAKLSGECVHTNELDDRRRALLCHLGFEPTSFDAERLDNLLPMDAMFDVVVMNPPFSATGGRVSGHNTAFGARHVEQALLRLRPGGRLVAIVGCGMAMERPSFRKWWQDIGNRFSIRASLGIDGRCFAKFGTTFDNQILVIDHAGSTKDLGSIRVAQGLDLHTAWDHLSSVIEENVYGRIYDKEPSIGKGEPHRALSRRSDSRTRPASCSEWAPPCGRNGEPNGVLVTGKRRRIRPAFTSPNRKRGAPI